MGTRYLRTAVLLVLRLRVTVAGHRGQVHELVAACGPASDRGRGWIPFPTSPLSALSSLGEWFVSLLDESSIQGWRNFPWNSTGPNPLDNFSARRGRSSRATDLRHILYLVQRHWCRSHRSLFRQISIRRRGSLFPSEMSLLAFGGRWRVPSFRRRQPARGSFPRSICGRTDMLVCRFAKDSPRLQVRYIFPYE